ncbi:hypothetical protein JCM17961_11090 [Endothiovibrio diazotrophicus]
MAERDIGVWREQDAEGGPPFRLPPRASSRRGTPPDRGLRGRSYINRPRRSTPRNKEGKVGAPSPLLRRRKRKQRD